MKSNRFISDHPEFGAFLKKELKQLDICIFRRIPVQHFR